MSTFSQLTVLALLSTAFAQPHGHQHARFHSGSIIPSGTRGTAPFRSGTGTGTRPHATSGTATRSHSSESTHSTTIATVITELVNAAIPSQWTSCEDEWTVTEVERVTVTVTGELSSSIVEANRGRPNTLWTNRHSTAEWSASSSSSTSSVDVAPVQSSSSTSTPTSTSSTLTPTPSTTSTSSSVYVAPTTSTSSSVYVAPTTSSSSSSAWVAPIASAASEAAAAVSSVLSPIVHTTTTSAAPAASSTWASSGSGSGKRGLAYNDAGLANMFVGAPSISWAYNWGSSSKGQDGVSLASGVNYLPLLWGSSTSFTNNWLTNARAAIAAGAEHLFSFNEPDLSTQSNLSPAAAAAAWKLFMEPLAGAAKLCAPAVTNGGGSMGLTWLSNFLTACDGCTISCLNIHWYDSATNVDYFKSHLTQAIALKPGAPVFVSEFGASGSSDQVDAFLKEVMPWMDANSAVAGYAYFMVSDGLLVNGTAPSTYGSTYRNYVGSS